MGGLAEGPEHGGGGLDGAEALAAHVADDGAHAVPGVDDFVEVAADAGVGGGGRVVDGGADGADPVGDGAQQDPPGDGGDQLGVGEEALLAQPQGGADPADHGDEDDGEDGGAVHGLGEHVVAHGHDEGGDLGAGADGEGVPGAPASTTAASAGTAVSAGSTVTAASVK